MKKFRWMKFIYSQLSSGYTCAHAFLIVGESRLPVSACGVAPNNLVRHTLVDGTAHDKICGTCKRMVVYSPNRESFTARARREKKERQSNSIKDLEIALAQLPKAPPSSHIENEEEPPTRERKLGRA